MNGMNAWSSVHRRLSDYCCLQRRWKEIALLTRKWIFNLCSSLKMGNHPEHLVNLIPLTSMKISHLTE